MSAVVDFALKSGREYVYIVHCHSNSNHRPSQSDISITLKIKNAIESIGMKFTDHIIVGIYSPYSLCEHKSELFTSVSEYIKEKN